ncbi:C4-dicarboxylate transporter DctA [Rhodopila globiformis]|uniref:C4-dicarboxylate transporter DctA n=1 Tax=Rhodopila globiformis TaxID=1071 RepID=A0A2S6MV15_RHOGL|nr:C4-dicarboxylate transporter DctA [Rhodopila globiformis]PPQ26192.1 C4-dicarboxylate transporter DctA [Rhodopila globiformis]
MAATTMKSAKGLYIQVLIGVVLGAALGHFWPDLAVKMQPFGTAFIKLVRMIIAPIIFVTVVVGIAKLSDAREVGRIGIKAIVYFEVMTTLAMFVGLMVAHVLQPGAGLNVDPASLDVHTIAKYTAPSAHQDVVGFLMNIIPNTVVDAFTKGEILQVLLFAVLFGLGLSRLPGDHGKAIVHVLDEAGAGLFGVIALIMRVAPLGAFGAMAFTIGKYGIGALAQLGFLMLCFYLTCVIFIFAGMGLVAAMMGLNIFKIVRFIKEEFLIVLGTSSSEAAMPTLMEKLELLGCEKSLVGLTVPLGYAFNLDGSSIYFTMAIGFIAQALNIPLSWSDYLLILAVLLLTSKGAAAVTGGGFITLAATLATMNGKVPVAGMVLLLGIDRFMSEARAITNLFGNTVATIFVAWWEGSLDIRKARAVLDRPGGVEEAVLAE